MVKPTVISLFAGCGGSSLGYKWAGYKELLAIEWDDNAVKTFKLNFSKVPIWQKDIKKVTGKEIMNFLNIKKGELDLLDGSPPCQGFSTAGKRVVIDKRNDLVNENIILIDELQPKVFVIENVSGMIKGKMKGLFIEYIKKMKSLNYQVKCKLMNAKYYNVPQSRERVIFIGVRKDLEIKPSYTEGNNKIITVKEAFKNCKIGEVKYLKGNKANLIKKLKIGQNMSKLTKNKYFNTLRLNPNKVCPTIPKLFGEAWGSFFAHWESNRSISINELKRLFTYSDDFIMIGTFKDQWAVIGNSVPPKFMQAIAEHIKKEILIKAELIN